jgi:hypothetical protein
MSLDDAVGMSRVLIPMGPAKGIGGPIGSPDAEV